MTNLSDYPKQTFVRTFDIEAISIPIVYNKYGDHDPNGMLYVLKKDSERIRRKAWECFEIQPPQPYKEVQPFVIRANKGDEIRVNFYNSLGRKASMHVQGLRYDVLTSDGANVGNNPDSTTASFISYVWYAEREGVYLFSDLGDPSGGEDGTNVHGLFGAIIVEKPQSRWFDPVTGDELESGLFADIYDPVNPAFREYAVFFHDELEILNKDGEQPVDPHTGLPNGTTAISYRIEPMRNRPPLDEMHLIVTGEDISMSSWVYGDPAPPILRAYAGDPATPILETYPGEPMVIRLLDGAHEEQHAFNINGMSWRKEITDPVSPIVAEQTIGISEAFNIRIDEYYGAGDYLYYFGGIDDVWFGLWGIIRAHSCRRKHLRPLCNPTKHVPTPICPPKGAKIRRFDIAAGQTDIEYNRYGDHDPEGMLFVPLEYAEDVKCGRKKPIPLILRANAGEWIEITLYNMFDKHVLYHDYPSVPLDMPHTPSDRVSLSPQFLKRCPVCSAGLNVGYNKPEQTAAPGECIRYLWYADKEYGTCMLSSFGDLRNHRYHGLFGAIIIEPPAAKYYGSSYCKKEIFGEQAVITAPGTDTFREFVLFAHNGIRLLDKKGNLIKTTAQSEGGAHGGVDHEDTGEKGYNYRSERFYNRLMQNSDISKVFSSKTHGDPSTPVFEAYTGERVIIRFGADFFLYFIGV